MFIKILALSLSFIVISTCLIVLSWLLNTYRYRASLSCIVIVMVLQIQHPIGTNRDDLLRGCSSLVFHCNLPWPSPEEAWEVQARRGHTKACLTDMFVLMLKIRVEQPIFANRLQHLMRNYSTAQPATQPGVTSTTTPRRHARSAHNNDDMATRWRCEDNDVFSWMHSPLRLHDSAKVR